MFFPANFGKSLRWLATCGLAVVAPATAHANFVANGSFTSTCPGGGYCTYSAGDSTDVPTWTVTQGSVDLITGYWQATPAGGNSVDLDGLFQAGGIQTSFATTAGDTYELSFELSGNPDGGDPLKTVEVIIAGVTQDFTFDTSTAGNTHSNMQWVKETLTFTATGALTSLSFTSLDAADSAYGAVIGDVDVEAVPEPASIGLLGIGLLSLMAFGRGRARKRLGL